MNLQDIDRAAEKLGGKFRLSALLQRRARELVRGAAALVEVEGAWDPADIALKEILADKVQVDAPVEGDVLGLRDKKD